MLQELQISNFTAGELSPRMKGRTDYAKYFDGLDTELNMVTMPQGGATKRPGTMFVALAKDQNPQPFAVRNLRFVFSTIQPYQLELGGGYIRVYADDAVALDGSGNPLTITVPYTTAEIAAVQFTQSADTLYLTHPNHPPATLTRLSQTNWTYQALVLLDGPYIDVNAIPQTLLTPSGLVQTTVTGAANNGSGLIELTVASTAGIVTSQQIAVGGIVGTTEANGAWTATVVDSTHLILQNSVFANTYTSGGLVTGSFGAITLTAAQTAGINGGAGFVATDVGRNLRFQSTDGTTSAWVWLVINTVVSDLQITATVQPATGANGSLTNQGVFQGAIASFAFALGAFTATLGYPYLVTFWQNRLMFLGNNNQPNASWSSNTAAFLTFSPTNADGAVVASNSLYWVISDDQVNAVRWVSMAGSAQTVQLGIGLAGSEDIMQPATTQAALSSTNIQVYRETAYGSAPNVPALRIGKAILFADLPGRKVREWSFYWQVNGYIGIDKTAEFEHITKGPPGSFPSSWGIRTMCYQQSPFQIIWAVRNDGGLIGFTYDNPQQIWASHRHQLGGQYYGGPPIVESVCAIPAPDASYDELWLVVLRTIAGVPTRFIEVMTRYFDGLLQDQAWFVDCALQSSLTMPAATASPNDFIATLPAAGTQAQTMPPGFTGAGDIVTSAPVFAGDATDNGKIVRINGGKAVITAPISTSKATALVILPLANQAPAASGAWSCTMPFAGFSGMSYANGEPVAVWADGAYAGAQTVAGGVINLEFKASYAIAGFPYTPVLVTMPFETQRAAIAQSRGKAKRALHLYLRFFETIGCNFGRRTTDPSTNAVEDVLEPLEFRLPGNPLNQPTPLFSGIKRLDARGGFDREGQIIVTQDVPAPLTVLSINASIEVGDLPVNPNA